MSRTNRSILLLGTAILLVAGLGASTAQAGPSSSAGCITPKDAVYDFHHVFLNYVKPSNILKTCKKQCDAMVDGCIQVLLHSEKCVRAGLTATHKKNLKNCEEEATADDRKACIEDLKAEHKDIIKGWLRGYQRSEAGYACENFHYSCLDSCPGGFGGHH